MPEIFHFAKGVRKKFEKFFTIPLPFARPIEYNKTAQISHTKILFRSDTNEHQSRY